MPPKGAFVLGDATRELVSRIESRTNYQHLFGRCSAFEPNPRTLDSIVTRRRDDDLRSHLEKLCSGFDQHITLPTCFARSLDEPGKYVTDRVVSNRGHGDPNQPGSIKIETRRS
jgi:hypothetical protein